MKAKFEGRLNTDFLEKPVDGKWFQTRLPFSYISKDGTKYRVPSYTYTDFASVPRGLRWLIPRVGKYGMASVVHDYLCDLSNINKFDRKKADSVFLEAMKTLGVSWWKRKVMYMGVSSYTMIKK